MDQSDEQMIFTTNNAFTPQSPEDEYGTSSGGGPYPGGLDQTGGPFGPLDESLGGPYRTLEAPTGTTTDITAPPGATERLPYLAQHTLPVHHLLQHTPTHTLHLQDTNTTPHPHTQPHHVYPHHPHNTHRSTTESTAPLTNHDTTACSTDGAPPPRHQQPAPDSGDIEHLFSYRLMPTPPSSTTSNSQPSPPTPTEPPTANITHLKTPNNNTTTTTRNRGDRSPQSENGFYTEIPYDQIPASTVHNTALHNIHAPSHHLHHHTTTIPTPTPPGMKDRQYHHHHHQKQPHGLSSSADDLVLAKAAAAASTLPVALGGAAGGESYIHLNQKQRTTAMSDFELYYPARPAGGGGAAGRGRRPCDKYTLLHVITMALTGVVYLTMGVLAGYYIATSKCGSSSHHHVSDDAITGGVTAVVPSIVSDHTTAVYPLGYTNNYNNLHSTELRDTANSDNTTTGNGDGSITTAPGPTIHPMCTYNSSIDMCECGPLGGELGRPFTDHTFYSQHGHITGFTVGYNDYFISRLQFMYDEELGSSLGHTASDNMLTVQLPNNEYITSVHLSYTSVQSYLTGVTFSTNLRPVLGPYGGPGATNYHIRGDKLLYIRGQAGALIDQLVLYFTSCV